MTTGRRVGVYYSWDRLQEITSPLRVIENRFPALFETRRMLYPAHTDLADDQRYDQGISGFLDHILRRNFDRFCETARAASGSPVIETERVSDDGTFVAIDDDFVTGLDTLIVISFDSRRTAQNVQQGELSSLRRFLDVPGNLLVVAPHHDIGDVPEVEFRHHGDKTIPPEQRFGGFARSVLAGLDVPVQNRFGLRPAQTTTGSPEPIITETALDRLGLLDGVQTFNLHPHLPHLERVEQAVGKLEVLARQRIDRQAPPHPFTEHGQWTFDALLQSRPGVFAGDLIVGDATLFSSTAGGMDSLQRLWANLLGRPYLPRRSEPG
ncbi:hypothetical protein [Mycobacterium sp. MS1601]|uniref:hypothetical protein n=1 Tax=Mycobacterium sp. MS1601 TaxID=1936029 RepID=UPI0009FA0E11|nr:hypothetical protein [Mycobacterium sp. MS1601]